MMDDRTAKNVIVDLKVKATKDATDALNRPSLLLPSYEGIMASIAAISMLKVLLDAWEEGIDCETYRRLIKANKADGQEAIAWWRNYGTKHRAMF